MSSPPSSSHILSPSSNGDSQSELESQSPPPPISWPLEDSLSLEWVEDLMSKLDWASRKLAPSDLPTLLPVQVFDRLVLVGSKILHKEPNCVRVDGGSKVVVVGDVHGQLHDVLFLLKDAGFPGEDRIYVFNGDYVDRGAWGLETFLLLLAWKVSSLLATAENLSVPFLAYSDAVYYNL